MIIVKCYISLTIHIEFLQNVDKETTHWKISKDTEKVPWEKINKYYVPSKR